MLGSAQTALMQKSRASASFETSDLTLLLWRSEDNIRKRRAAFKRVEQALGTYDNTKLPPCYSRTSREDLFKQGLAMGKVCLEDMLEYDHDLFVWATPRYNLVNASPFGHKAVLFEPAMEHNGTAEQKAKWLSIAECGEILGTYAQTELGHGSFVRGIETTATFDRDADELVVHSPTISSTKFWPAGLGFSTTHGTVMARLLVDSKDYGPHYFIVQLRSVKDGKPLPGIKMGDIGLKMGYNEADNGFASFDHVRIPRSHMLMAHSQLTRSGTYTKDPIRAKLSYSVMLLVRSKMPGIFSMQFAQATTIAARYSVVREQGLGPADALKAETTIIQYKHQHFRLLSLIAKSFAMFFASRTCEAEYNRLRERQSHGDHTLLASAHALIAGLKAYVTSEAVDGAEDARKLCGGHGYMVISGLPDIIGALAGGATFEGENYVLWQQLGRHLLKQLDRFQDGESIDPQIRYLTGEIDVELIRTASAEDFLDSEVQLSIYRNRAYRLTFKAHTAIRSSTKTPAEAWNEHMMLLISASRAHIEYFVLKSFVDLVISLSVSTSTTLRAVLDKLSSLFALSNIINPRSVDALSLIEADGTQASYLNGGQLDNIRTIVNHLLDQLVPEIIALTDAWDFSDASLCSALGMHDGNVYENIMCWVKQMPINEQTWKNDGVHEGWHEWVDPILRGKAGPRAKL